MTIRVLKLSFIVTLLTPFALLGQGLYRIALCPGPAAAYHSLAEKVSKITEPDKKKAEDLLIPCLNTWQKDSKLTRFQVAIYYPDRTMRYWQSSSGEKASLFNESASAAAGRGGLNTDAKMGDNQRCFFQDTTVVLDTLHIRLGDFSSDTPFTISIGGKNYPVPLNTGRTELLLYAGMAPGVSSGRYQPVTVVMDKETRPVTFYFLSPDDRSQLVRSLRAWTSENSPICTELPDRLVTYLTRNWGGKQCANPALYHSSLRHAVRNLIQSEKISCTP